jgi:hypothetical protein
MSRQVYLLGVGLALVALALAVIDVLLGPRPGITEANVRRIRPGMTYGEVEDLLGYPPFLKMLSIHRASREEIVELIRIPEAAPRVKYGSNSEVAGWPWDSEEGMAVVNFGVTGRVEKVRWFAARLGTGPSPFARLRDWLGW